MMTEEEAKKYEPKIKKLQESETNIKGFCKQYGYRYKLLTHKVLINTDFGLWQIRIILGENDYQILHHNTVHTEVDLENNSKQYKKETQWHYQKDFSSCKSLQKALNYIHNHDRARKIEKQSIKDMPTNTLKLRNRIKQAKKRKKRNEVANVYRILDKLNNEKRPHNYYDSMFYAQRGQGKKEIYN